jgi:signal transduction histidine kinase
MARKASPRLAARSLHRFLLLQILRRWQKIAASDPDQVKAVSSIITRQVGHMANIVDDLLDLSRVTSGLPGILARSEAGRRFTQQQQRLRAAVGLFRSSFNLLTLLNISGLTLIILRPQAIGSVPCSSSDANKTPYPSRAGIRSFL